MSTEDGKMRDLGTLPGGMESFAIAISERGQIVGWADTKVKSDHAFLWQNGKMIDLGKLPRGMESDALAINNKGQVVGLRDTGKKTEWGYAYRHAVLWTLKR